MENNRAGVPSETLEDIAKILGVDADELKQLPKHPRLTKQQAGAIDQAATVDQKLAFEELKADVQGLKAEMAEVKSTLQEMNSYLREIVRPPVPQPDTVDAVAEVMEREPPVDIVQVLERAEKSGQAIEVKTLDIGQDGIGVYNWKKAAQWHKEITEVEKQAGNLFLVMKGFQGITVPPEIYEEQVRPIPEKGVGDAAVMRHTLDCIERRRTAFENHVRQYKFHHIMPIGALVRYNELGLLSFYASSSLSGAEFATFEQQAEHIRFIIHLLTTYDNYKIGLLTGEAGENPVYNRFIWEVKGHTLLIEDHASGQRNFIVKDRLVVGEVCRHFARLWKSEGAITDKDKVIELLKNPVESHDQTSIIS